MYEIMKTWKPPNWKSLEEYENVTAFFLSIHPNKKYENLLSARPNWGGRDQPGPLSNPPEDQRKILKKKDLLNFEIWSIVKHDYEYSSKEQEKDVLCHRDQAAYIHSYSSSQFRSKVSQCTVHSVEKYCVDQCQ